MNTRILLIIIAMLLLVIAYLLYQQRENETGSTIQIGEPIITNTPTPAQEENVTEEVDVVPDSAAEDVVTFSGLLVGFVDGKDEFLGSFKYALIDDGTEIIQIDLRSIVGYDVTELEAALGVAAGERVTVSGNLKNGEFVPTALR